MHCTSCGEAIEPGARFCAACGAAVPQAAQAQPPAEREDSGRERKVATLLFADLVGFTGLNEAHDPEMIEAVVTRAFDRLSAEVTRYEGTLEKFAGDAMLAVFGVPTVHEDDPERAVRAALEMQQAMAALGAELEAEGRPALAVRIGIETGEVLADRGRAANERDRMVTGDAVNTAARLEQAAAAGAILVGPRTHEATRETVDYEALDPIALKGKAEPVAAWRAIAVKTRRGGIRPVLGIEAPLIGRDEELTLLKETVRRTVAEGRPHLVTVLGAAGVGKSRLTWELEKYLDGLPDVFHWRKGRCLAYAQTSYSALADAIASDASVLEDDPPEAVGEKLAARLATLVPEGAPASVESAARTVMGLPAEGAPNRDELFESWRTYLELIARRAPLVLVMEDIHWADEGLLDFIEFLTRWSETPIMILALARHELLERRPAWGGGLPNAASIVLEPLPPGESDRMLEALLGDALPPSVRERVIQVSEGNPLFTEELVRLFIDRGVVRQVDGRWERAAEIEQVEIPQSIHTLLAARLDGLPSEEKRLSQDAAVVGRIFWDRLLAHLVGQSPTAVVALLRRLRAKELVVPREPSTLTDAAEYAFRHVLIRDVAYESLPKLDRARKHREVATWAEEQLGERANELVELLAAHYWSALRYEEEFSGTGGALDDLRRKTLEYAHAAAKRASEVGQGHSAAEWLRIVVEQSARLDLPAMDYASAVLEYVQAGFTFEDLGGSAVEVDSALARLEALPDQTEAVRRLQADLLSWRAYALFEVSQDPVAARAAIQDGLARIEGIGPCEERARLLTRLGWLAWRGGPVTDAIEPLEAAVSEARTLAHDGLERWAMHELGMAYERNGRHEEGIALLRDSLQRAEAANDRRLWLRTHTNLSGVLSMSNDYREAIPLLQTGLDHARRAMESHFQYWLAINLAGAAIDMGELRDADTYTQEAIAAARRVGLPLHGSLEAAWLCILLGAYDESQAIIGAWGDVEPELQAQTGAAIVRAALAWRADPQRATAQLLGDLQRAQMMDHYGPKHLARMAVRVGHREALEWAIESMNGFASGAPDSPIGTLATWVGALADADDDPGRAADDVARAGQQLEERWGLRLFAALAYADAAWIAARAGLPDADERRRRAAEAHSAIGAVPLLEPLPMAAAAEP